MDALRAAANDSAPDAILHAPFVKLIDRGPVGSRPQEKTCARIDTQEPYPSTGCFFSACLWCSSRSRRALPLRRATAMDRMSPRTRWLIRDVMGE